MLLIRSFNIAGYARISVDEELDRDNTSIENQKAIIQDFAANRFPDSALTFFEDRDRSGYTFEQREGYREMRRGLMSHDYDILIVKDFSRFSRRNSRGLVELEDLRDAGVRIISIGDGIDFPNDDDWLKIQFQFLINEMPVTDTSKKVRAVVRRRQEDGKWVCAAPYGYIINPRQEFEVVPAEAEIVRRIFALYNGGWGYKRIANLLTDQGIPTPRMSQAARMEAEGREPKLRYRREWSTVSVQGILENDFYIGTFRQAKYTRAKINGKDVKRRPEDNIVLENHHQAVISCRDFRAAAEMRARRTAGKACYRGTKKYTSAYAGLLVCGDCGSPMFSMSRGDPVGAYRCGLYHRRGRSGCTSHHIRVDTLDSMIKEYLRRVRAASSPMLEKLNADMQKQEADIDKAEDSAGHLEAVRAELAQELQITRRQRMRDIMKHPEREDKINDSYDRLEEDLESRIAGLEKQLRLMLDRRNTVLRVNRAAKTALDVFDGILEKDRLEARDLHLIVEKIRVYEDHAEIQLKADIDSLLSCGVLPEAAADFHSGTGEVLQLTAVQPAAHRPDKLFRVNVVSDGDPLEIYTEKDGEVIFKKYSPMGELSGFAGEICESLSKSTGAITAVCDRDNLIAVAGGGRKELQDRPISKALEEIMENRRAVRTEPGPRQPQAVDGVEGYTVSAAAPILSEGDVLGCVVFLSRPGGGECTELEFKLAQTVAGFLGRQMES